VPTGELLEPRGKAHGFVCAVLVLVRPQIVADLIVLSERHEQPRRGQ
jgi:hypothetical protein